LSLVALVVAVGALLQPVVHEYVPDPATDMPPVAGHRDAPRAGEATTPGPGADERPSEGEPVLGEAAPVTVRPDADTVGDGVLRYWEPFDPGTAPFSRSVVLDAVGDDYALGVQDAALRPVPVGGAPRAGRDSFRASYLVRFSGGRPVPIPSVAADLRVLQIAVEPDVPVEVLKNGADAIFLRSPLSGTRRVTMLVDAPAAYFAPRIPPGLTVREAGDDTHAQLPRGAQRAAALVLDRLAIGRDDPLDVALDRLVGHFRSFEAGAFERASGDLYVDLALGGRGACRHRALAFVVTAQALGIPARYIQNEAHAFAEIWLSGSGWARVDLGGAALSLDVAGARDKTMYHAGPDPFPQPAPYARGYSRLGGMVGGLPAGAAAPRALRPDETPLPDVGARAGSRPPTHVVLDRHETSGVRGEAVRASGRVLDDRGAPLPGMRVDLYLSPDGERRGLLLGTVLCDARGEFALEVVVPADAPVGRYQLVAVAPGDARHAPGRSP
jgi:transglutaminase-like putative cysteine protease